jgi:hypothetical protein
MTKKHYLVVEVSGGLADIYDNITEENIMDVNEAVNKLNELTLENQRLHEELQRIYDIATANRAIQILEEYYDKLLSRGSDEIKDAERRIVLKCIEQLKGFKDEI